MYDYSYESRENDFRIVCPEYADQGPPDSMTIGRWFADRATEKGIRPVTLAMGVRKPGLFGSPKYRRDREISAWILHYGNEFAWILADGSVVEIKYCPGLDPGSELIESVRPIDLPRNIVRRLAETLGITFQDRPGLVRRPARWV